MNGLAEAYDAQHAFTLAKDLRNEQLSMGVWKPPSSTGDYYVGLLAGLDMEKYGMLFEEGEQVGVCLEPSRAEQSTSGRKQSGKRPKDDAPGFRAIVLDEDSLLGQADVMILVQMPANPEYALANFEMPSGTNVNNLPSVKVYLKLFPSAITVRSRLNALDKNSEFHRPEPNFESKRQFLVGRELPVDKDTDLFAGLTDEQMTEYTSRLNDGQIECFTRYLRKVSNNVALVHGAFDHGREEGNEAQAREGAVKKAAESIKATTAAEKGAGSGGGNMTKATPRKLKKPTAITLIRLSDTHDGSAKHLGNVISRLETIDTINKYLDEFPEIIDFFRQILLIKTVTRIRKQYQEVYKYYQKATDKVVPEDTVMGRDERDDESWAEMDQ